MKVDSCIFYSNDISKVILFVKDVLGIDPEMIDSDDYTSFLFANGVRLGVKKKSKEREIPGAQTIILEIEKIEDYANQLKQKQIKFYSGLEQYGWGKSFSILDPDGNKIEFLEK